MRRRGECRSRRVAASAGNGEHADEDTEGIGVFGGGEAREPVPGRVHADHHRGAGRGLHTGPCHPGTAARGCDVCLRRIAGDFLQYLRARAVRAPYLQVGAPRARIGTGSRRRGPRFPFRRLAVSQGKRRRSAG